MVSRLAALLTICTCVLTECECGGTLAKPVLDTWLCDHLVPPGMEGTEPDTSFSLYMTAMFWHRDVVMVNVYGGGAYQISGCILQGRVNNITRGKFIEHLAGGTALDCEPYLKNTWYYMNFTSPATTIHAFWMPPQNYLGRNLTMHTTIIRDNHTYFQYVDAIPPNRGLTTSTTSPTTFTTTTEKVISISGEEEPTGQSDVPTTGGG